MKGRTRRGHLQLPMLLLSLIAITGTYIHTHTRPERSRLCSWGSGLLEEACMEQ